MFITAEVIVGWGAHGDLDFGAVELFCFEDPKRLAGLGKQMREKIFDEILREDFSKGLDVGIVSTDIKPHSDDWGCG